mmetsp:Transcript_34381/g.95058  ORF Transcript_34381/g.95058 Transcript_34381/m.95058 type:complete len:207 (-) Transcript_34381:1106-1726(-)
MTILQAQSAANTKDDAESQPQAEQPEPIARPGGRPQVAVWPHCVPRACKLCVRPWGRGGEALLLARAADVAASAGPHPAPLHERAEDLGIAPCEVFRIVLLSSDLVDLLVEVPFVIRAHVVPEPHQHGITRANELTGGPVEVARPQGNTPGVDLLSIQPTACGSDICGLVEERGQGSGDQQPWTPTVSVLCVSTVEDAWDIVARVH